MAAAPVRPLRTVRAIEDDPGLDADTDLRLCRFFGLSNGYWLCAQVAHDTEVARETLADELKKIKPWPRTAA